MTAVLTAGGSWRWGYAGVGLAQLALAACFALTARRWREPAVSHDLPSGGQQGDAGMGASLKLPVVGLSIGVFLLMAGVESIAGQWPYSLFTEERGISPTAAGVWMSVYWGALTAGRILYGLAGSRLRVVFSLRVAMVGVVLGAALLWQRSIALLSFLGLAMIGFSIAPLIPLLQLVTPRRVGAEHTANVIGFQTAAGYLGVGVLPALAGLLADSRGLETLGPSLLVSSLLMVLIHEAIHRRSVGKTTTSDTRPNAGKP
jgi:fucose permease